MVWSACATCTWKQGNVGWDLAAQETPHFFPLHYFILWWFYDGLREEYPGKDGGKRRGESGCAQLAQVTNASVVQHLLSFEVSAISPMTEHQRLWFFAWRLCHWYLGCCVAGLSTSDSSALYLKKKKGNIDANVAHHWTNIRQSVVLKGRDWENMRKRPQLTFWLMSLSLLFHSMVANITDPITWKECALP